MPFRWSLNPYMGCAHRCTFCYVRHFEQRADRPSDDRYGRSIRVKPNVAEVLRRELARRSWQHEEVALGTATDPYQPAEGRFRLTRACIVELAASGTPFSIVTRGPLVVRDLDVLRAAAAEVRVERVRLPPDPGRAGVADDRAGHSAADEPPPGGARARRRRDRRRHRHGADPARPLGSRRAARGRRPRSPRSGCARDLGELSSTCGRVSASTSSRRSHTTGPSTWSATRRCSARARTCPRRSRTRSPRRCVQARVSTDSPSRRRPVRPQPRQLSLSI